MVILLGKKGFVFHIDPGPSPGGDVAAREPWPLPMCALCVTGSFYPIFPHKASVCLKARRAGKAAENPGRKAGHAAGEGRKGGARNRAGRGISACGRAPMCRTGGAENTRAFLPQWLKIHSSSSWYGKNKK